MQKSVNPINLQGTEKFGITFPILLLMVTSSCTVSGFPGSKRPSSLVAQMVKNPPAMWEIWVCSLGWEDPLEEEMATHCGIPAWRIPKDRGAWRAAVHGVTKSQT